MRIGSIEGQLYIGVTMSQLPKEIQEVLNHVGQLCQQSDQARNFGNLELAKLHRLNAAIFLSFEYQSRLNTQIPMVAGLPYWQA